MFKDCCYEIKSTERRKIMKRLMALILTAAIFMVTLSSCENKENSSKSVSASDSETETVQINYYPHNTFSDVDAQYAYFALKEGIYKKSLAEDKYGKYQLIFESENEITSLAVWKEYIYFLSNGNLCRVDNDGQNYKRLLSDDELKNKASGLSACYMRIAGDRLYVDVNSYFDGYRIYDLAQSDTARVFTDNTGSNRSSTPFDALCDNWAYVTTEHDECWSPNEIIFKLDAVNAHFLSNNKDKTTTVKRSKALFDYKSQNILEYCGYYINVYRFDGTLKKQITIPDDYTDVGGKYHLYKWGNAYNGKAYQYAYPINSNSNEIDTYSMIIYDIEAETEQVIDMPAKYKISGWLTWFDIIDGLLYWRNADGDLICCDPADDSVEIVNLN